MDTTPDVKDQKKEEKKKAGFLANLVGKPASNAPLAIGGLGSGSGAASPLASLFAGTPFASLFTSGILATKAGLIAAALIATALVGSLGYVGYKFFGAGANDKAGTGYSLFAPRPAEDQRAIEAERAAEDGRSASLDAFAKANAGASGEGAQASDAQAGEASGGVVADAAAPAASASPNLGKNSGNVSGNKAAKGLGAGKFGQMSKLSLGGGAGNLGGGGSSASTSLAPAGVQAGKGGKISPMAGKKSPSAGTRGLARKLGQSGAMAQLHGVKGDQRGAASSLQAGSTYDGGPRMPISPMAEPTTSAGALPAGDKSGTPNPTGMVTDNFPDPPKPSAAGWACPWENAMRIASMAILAGVALLFVAGKLMSAPDVSGMTKVLAYGLVAMAAVAGALAVKMGQMIAQPPYGQQLQGGMFTGAGAALMASSGLMIASFATSGSVQTLLQILMVTSGAAALGMLAVAKLSEPKKYPSWKFQDGQAPDYNHQTTDKDGRVVGKTGLFS